jgi:two-component system, sensor histidine kinase and response regulator
MRQLFKLNLLQYGWRPLGWALVILTAGLALSALGVYVDHQRLDNIARQQFNEAFDRIEASIRTQFNQPLYGLRGAMGVQASLQQTAMMPRSHFRAYVASRDLPTEFPGTRGFGYIERVPRSNLSAFEAAEKSDGAPDFKVNTSGNASDLYVIKYIEPLTSNYLAQGLDIGVDSIRMESIDRAIETGDPTLSGAIQLVQDGQQGAGFLYLIPAYAAGAHPDTPQQRRAELRGFYYAPLVVNDLLFKSIFSAQGMADFELLDGTHEATRQLVFSSQKMLAPAHSTLKSTPFEGIREFSKTRTIPIGGRLLQLRAGSSALFESELNHSTPLFVGLGGSILSLLMAAIVWLMLVGRARAETMAHGMTQELEQRTKSQKWVNDQLTQAMRESQTLMDAIDQHSMVSISDPAGVITYVNETFINVSGYSRAELMGQNHRIVKSDAQSDAFWLGMWKTISSGKVWRGVVCNRAKNGHLYWVDTLISPFFDDKGIEKYISIRTDITATKLAQQTISKDHERLNNIIMGTHAGTWELNIQTRQGVINARWAEIIGYDLEELRPWSIRTWSDHCHPEDLQRVSKFLMLHVEGHLDYYECEFRMRHRSGAWVWVQDRGKVSSWTEDGKPEWVAGTHMDISEKKQAEEALHRTNTVMQSILDNIPVGLSAFDGNLHLIASNRQFQSALDFPDELFAKPVTTFESLIEFNAARGEYGNSESQAAVAKIIRQARNPTPHYFERVRPNGTALEVRGAPIPGGGFVTTYADISQRKQAEMELARTTTLLQSVLSSASTVAMITTSLDNTITLFNTGAEHMLGYTAAEVVGIHTPALFTDTQEIHARAIALSNELGQTVADCEVVTHESTLGKKTEWTHIRKDASRFAAALVITPLTNTQGIRTGYLGISHDISVEKDYENWLRAAMQEAQAATTAKSQFLANMSHEIRTPMNAILGMLKLLQNTELTQRQLDYASKTEGAAKSLLSLLNDILDFSKIDAGKMTLDVQPFRLDRLMRDLSVILSANILDKSIEVLFDLDPATPKALVGDSMRLQQVLINLSGNAIKFTARGEVIIRIRVLEQTSAGSTLQFSVRDSGIGIAPESQKHIFDGFTQAEASTTRRFGGTGLGLSISKQLVSLMGGELALESVLGQGSTFHFTLTLPVAEALTIEAALTLIRHPTPLRVLVVDDHPDARAILATMAHAWGWHVDTASSGAEALDMINARAQEGYAPYEAIIVDWQMPVMDGWETILRMRQVHASAQTPITVMVTAHGREMLSHRTDHEQAHLDAYLVKPITASMLFDAVTEARSGQGHVRSAPAARTATQRPLTGLRLLVVEDNAINQQVAQELLSAEGAWIEIAGNGQWGVDAVAHANPPFDAVLMDIQMPVMDGYAATHAIRFDLGMTDLPIIAMTANAMASDRDACIDAGMNEHVGKPFDLPHLIQVLQKLTRPHLTLTSAATDTALPDSDTHGAPVVDPDETDIMPPMEAIDTEGALERLGDNTALYGRILQAYLLEIEKMPDQLDNLLHTHDSQGAAQLLHTAKGLSATVGATYMTAIAKKLESVTKDESKLDEIAPWQTLFRTAVTTTHAILTSVARGFTGHDGVQSPAASSGPLPDTTLQLALLEELNGLLQHSDMHALDVYAQLQALGISDAPDTGQALNAAITAFDFPQALVQCQAMIQTLRTRL